MISRPRFVDRSFHAVIQSYEQMQIERSLIVRVEPEAAPEWVGYFEAGGLGGIDGVFACPNPVELCAVAQGQPYVIDIQDPSKCWRPEVSPVIQVEASPEAAVLVLADFTELSAIGGDGIRWESGRLCLDGLKIQRVSGSEIHCQGDYLEGSEPFVIDALSGSSSLADGSSTPSARREVKANLMRPTLAPCKLALTCANPLIGHQSSSPSGCCRLI
jgi:hypothetical protein